MEQRTCYIDNDCSQSGEIVRGLCAKHYARLLRYGDPLGRPVPKPRADPKSDRYSPASDDLRAMHRPKEPDLPGETWRAIPSFEGLYEASDMGRVRSLDRIDTFGKYKKGCLLKGTRTKYGYLRITLWRDGVPTPCFIHQAVMLTFVGEPPSGQMTRHGPNGATDNSLANLCYGTHEENCHDKLRDGTQRMGTQIWIAKLTDDEVREIRSIYALGGVTQKELALRYGVVREVVGKIVRRQIWKHVA